MKILIITVNVLLMLLFILIGVLYPSVMEWTYLVIVVLTFQCFLELLIAYIDLLKVAKICTWMFQVFSTLISCVAFLLYKLNFGNYWMLIGTFFICISVLATLVVILVFKTDGVGNRQFKGEVKG